MRHLLSFDRLESKISLSQVVSIPPVTVGPAPVGPPLATTPGALIGPIAPSGNDPTMPINQNPGDLPGTGIPTPQGPSPFDPFAPVGDFPSSNDIQTVC